MSVSVSRNGAKSSFVLPLKAVLPGLLAITALDGLAVVGIWKVIPHGDLLHSLLLLVTPWITVWLTREKPNVYGYHGRRFLLDFGWGMVAGGCWRLGSLLLNMALLGWSMDSFGAWLSALVWVPFLEETFFRGYLCRSLASFVGVWPGIIIQAILFALQPYHLGQGWIGLLSVFVFGILAGWLMHRRDSIWAAWGAHAFANVILIPLTSFV